MSGRLQDCCGHRQAGRLIFIDALRVALVAFVIVHHAAQAYGPTGGFWPVHDHAQSDWFNPFYTVNAAFGMGLLFLVAGYFTDASLEREGPGAFPQRTLGSHRRPFDNPRSAGTTAGGLSDRRSGHASHIHSLSI
jgi:hypothetical protein